jgi:hypothetical protein
VVIPDEAATQSLLANDYQKALKNTALRTWEKSLYIILYSMWGRIQDEQLYVHNNTDAMPASLS